jgi:GTP cyclohydrolase III
MSINNPVIAGAPVTTRADAKTVVGTITSTVPPAPRVLTVDGEVVAVSQNATKEGQILFYRNGDELFVTMYIAVYANVGNGLVSLKWRAVENWGFVQDPRTGLGKDPNLEFYSTLAS